MVSTVLSLKAGYVAVFSVAAIGCLVATWRARTIADADTRLGLIGLLITSAGWAAAQALRLFTTTPLLGTTLYLGGLVCGLATIGSWLYFCSAYTGQMYHRNPRIRWGAVGLFVSITAIKLTNPLHQLYFTIELVTTPFPHLVIDQLGLHWAVTVMAYALTSIGFYMLFQLFTESQIPTTDLGVLVSLTALPVIFDVLGFLPIAWILKLNYEPIGVAAFAIGVLYVTEDTFEQVRWTGNRQVLDALNEAVIVVDENNEIRDYNETTTDLFPELQNASTARLTDVLPAIDAAVTPNSDAPENDDIITYEDTETGDTRYYLVSVTRLTIGPHTVGAAVVCTDVTRMEQQRRQLQSQTEQLDGFAAAITHELRNTLAIANGNLEIIADTVEETGQDATMEAIETVDEATDRMTTIVGELATLARLGQPTEELDTVQFQPTIRHLWEIVGSDDVTLTIDGNGMIEADTERLEELLRNVGQLAVATEATDLVVGLHADGITLTTNGDSIDPDAADAFFKYGMAVPTTETGMLGPNIQT
ncbi:MAG: histidine kinase N-terminal 7TM domain-containing protein, partial [Halobacteriales archaeon]